ncbi:MAG: RNA 3'-terminal phosphate cyclase [Syntrophobacteraceae bacterium]|nr:RNA 3'-terminal phosphate cyclase [Syntrophobacteraceae bacterium]
MIEIDGSVHSGSGTLLRCSAALATLLGESLHLVRIRARRDKPGLRPQHLQAIRACRELCGGDLEGDHVGSREITYRPGPLIEGGARQWDIGTAGSATMLSFCVLPLGVFALQPSSFRIRGGLFQDNAPSLFHMQHVLLPILERTGVRASLRMIRPGYIPQGEGELVLEVAPRQGPLDPLTARERGRARQVRGISLASHLKTEGVSRRMAEEARRLMGNAGLSAVVDMLEDDLAVQKGAALALWMETETGCRLGSDQAGKRGRRSEAIAAHVVRTLIEDYETGATVDRFLADQLILFAALAAGRSEIVVPRLTDHLSSNLWLVEKMLGARAKWEGSLLRIDGIGYHRS